MVDLTTVVAFVVMVYLVAMVGLMVYLAMGSTGEDEHRAAAFRETEPE